MNRRHVRTFSARVNRLVPIAAALAALAAQGTPVGETYAGQILGEWRTAHPSPNGSRRKR
jgi:hypothetical protein